VNLVALRKRLGNMGHHVRTMDRPKWKFGSQCWLMALISFLCLQNGQGWATIRRQSRITSTSLLATSNVGEKPYKHTLAILTMPSTSTDKIANEAILNQAVKGTEKLSVVLRANGNNPSLARLRQYVGEVYSTLWDCAMSLDSQGEFADGFCDVVVYPQNLPNAAPEQWIHHAPDLDSVCSHDSICGWISQAATGRGVEYQSIQGQGVGGLDAHVRALNADRDQRGLDPVRALHVTPWPMGASAVEQQENHVLFLDDEIPKDAMTANGDATSDGPDDEGSYQLIGGVKLPSGYLFDHVAVGGTFDGMHYGHRKLLTLAVSSVSPTTGKLTIGVTVDDMLTKKAYADQIPDLQERMDGTRDFIYRLAPGIKNRVKLLPISDAYGPPGTIEHGTDFDALVLSHETLENGCKLNEYRTRTLGLRPLALLCTRRTEPHGMSSTALRRRKWEKRQRTLRSEVSQ
jgi:cytidyltransferase-like protein